MNKEDYIKALKKIFKWNYRSRVLFKQQINYYFDAKNNTKKAIHNYNIGDEVLLKQHQFMRGEGALSELDEKKIKFISENGFVSPDFTKKYNKKQKTPLTIPVWNIQKDILLKDYIINYSGATLKYSTQDGKKTTKIIPYKKIDEEIENIRQEDFWSWQCEQTKEIRFMPSLSRDKIQLAFIMNINDECGKKLIKNDIFNLDFDKKVLKTFISKWFRENYIYAKRDDFTTNRESAILFGIPSCYIEGLLVGRNYEKNEDILNSIKKYFPNCYICNLDGKVIKI